MDIFVPSVGKITLKNNNFLAKGGEATLYVQGNTVFKIFDDKNNLPHSSKLDELKVLNSTNIIIPIENIFKSNGKDRIGFTMRLLQNTYCWNELYTNTFKSNNNFEIDQQLKLIDKFKQLIEFIHSKNILVVDLNEFNFLVDKNLKEIYGIDVTSYQTRGFPARVIMPSIKDYKSLHFSENTDWFSWGILTFNLLIGIHPFKGNYQLFDNLPIEERLKQRILNGISVLDPTVKIPRICKPFSIIPENLLNWYKSVFSGRLREKPPSDFFKLTQIVIKQQNISGTNLKITKIYKIKGKTVWGIKDKTPIFSPYILTPNMEIISGKVEHNKITLGNSTFFFDKIIQYDNRLLLKKKEIITEIICYTTNILNEKHVGNILDFPHTTKIYDGIIIQNMLGRHFYSIFPHPGMCYQNSLKDFDKSKILSAKFDKKFAQIISFEQNNYYKTTFELVNNTLQEIDKEIVDETSEINFVVTISGLFISIPCDGELKIIQNRKITTIKDDTITTGISLLTNGSNVFGILQDEIYQMQTL